MSSELITAILGMGWVTAGAAWWRERTKHQRELRDYLQNMRQEYASEPDLMEIVRILKEEHGWRGPGEFTTDKDPFQMRDLPAFLEPIGIKLMMDPKAPDDAYDEFKEEVLLCHHSNVLWKYDDYKTDCTYWPYFKKFAEKLDKGIDPVFGRRRNVSKPKPPQAA